MGRRWPEPQRGARVWPENIRLAVAWLVQFGWLNEDDLTRHDKLFHRHNYQHHPGHLGDGDQPGLELVVSEGSASGGH